MTERYEERRRELVIEANNLRKIRCYLSAKARIRKIAQLDLKYKGVPIEETYDKFNYYEKRL